MEALQVCFMVIFKNWLLSFLFEHDMTGADGLLERERNASIPHLHFVKRPQIFSRGCSTSEEVLASFRGGGGGGGW